ncbi:alpha/beta hydrolase family protein [Ferrimonas gelatinilytica]|uniref:alpha/beta hydrolase family protein n=1 Tax=Ferrimonas gelatinilytica TaxID=1255257 RepID=UPI0031EBDB12
MKKLILAAVLWAGWVITAPAAPVTPEAIMAFETLEAPVLSDNGEVVAYVGRPDRGDPVGYLRRGDGHTFTLPRAADPQLSADGAYALFVTPPALLERENADKKERKALKSGRLLVNSRSGMQLRFERVKSAQFSHDGRFLLVWHEADEATDAPGEEKAESDNEPAPTLGSRLMIRDLKRSLNKTFERVHHLEVAADGFGIAFSTATGESAGNGIYRLDSDLNPILVWQESSGVSGDLALSRDGRHLAFTWGDDAVPKRQREHRVAYYFDEDLQWQDLNHADYLVSGFSELTFSRDAERLFIGRQARRPEVRTPEPYADNKALRDSETLLAHRQVQVWHGDDERIKPNEQNRFDEEFKRQYQGVWHLDDDLFIQLTDPLVPDLQLADNTRYLLAHSDQLYRKMISWAGFYRDWYLVDLRTGQRRRLVEQTLEADEPSLSPHDEAVIWHVRGALKWHDIKANRTVTLGKGFADEDHDYPSPAPGYGMGPWLEPGQGALVYDKYDVFQARGGELTRLTEGRDRQEIFRVVESDPEARWAQSQVPLLLHRHNEVTREEGLARYTVATETMEPWLRGSQRYRFVTKAKGSDAALFTLERYDRYPDLQRSLGWQGQLEQVSHLGKQLETLDWGRAQRISWRSRKGEVLSGVVITPPGYDGSAPLPTIVYFYRFMSDRLHQFPQMALNHRPNFPWFASEGYAVFLPDVRFEIGHPGRSTADALIPGVETLIRMGITDPDAVGLQGHSWAGYQSAQLVTLTDMFKAVVTGAPVANMTSAYTGIRLGSGLGRQFQYEAGQSRIGRSLYEAPELYIENSPVFHAEKINTPMVIMFGDRDDAVPWEQGIELYLAMRRLSKPVVMLQYEDEPHHLKKYPNKLDYSLKMMAFFNHTLKGAPAPHWWRDGVPYSPEDPKE